MKASVSVISIRATTDKLYKKQQSQGRASDNELSS